VSSPASTLWELGKLDEAASMKREVLEKRRRILRGEHANTISAMGNLAGGPYRINSYRILQFLQ